MTFANPLGLLGLLALPLIIALHRRRRRPRVRIEVATLLLFGPDALPVESGRRKARLVRSPSLWLELIAATAATLWLTGIGFATDEHARCVLVLDDSASMAAIAPLDELRTKVAAICAAEFGDPPAHTPLTVICSGSRARVIGGPDAPYADLEATLATWHPAARDHDLHAALDSAAGFVAAGGRVLVLTDTTASIRPSMLPPNGVLVAIGKPRDNLAITRADRLPGDTPERELVRVEVRAFTTEPATTRVHLRDAGGRDLAQRELSLEPDETVVATFAPRAISQPYWVTLEAATDALGLDSRADLLPPHRTPLRIASTLGTTLDRRLGMDRLPEVFDAVETAPPTIADLVFCRQPSAARPGVREVLFAPTGPVTMVSGPFINAPWHPLLDGVPWAGVLWAAGTSDPAGTPLLRSANAVLITERWRPDGGRTLQCNLDPTRADVNLWSRPAWPILLHNLVRAARDEAPGPGPANIRVGELLRYRPLPSLRGTTAQWLAIPREPTQGARPGNAATENGSAGDGLPRRRSLDHTRPNEPDVRDRGSRRSGVRDANEPGAGRGSTESDDRDVNEPGAGRGLAEPDNRDANEPGTDRDPTKPDDRNVNEPRAGDRDTNRPGVRDANEPGADRGLTESDDRDVNEPRAGNRDANQPGDGATPAHRPTTPDTTNRIEGTAASASIGPATAEWTHAPRQIGIYELRAGGRLLARYAVHFADPVESDLRTRNAGRVTANTTPATVPSGSDVAATATTAEDRPAESRNRPSRLLRTLSLLVLLVAALADYGWLATRGSR